METNIQTCPECDNDALLLNADDNRYFVWCQGCKIQTGLYSKKEDAIKEWNDL